MTRQVSHLPTLSKKRGAGPCNACKITEDPQRQPADLPTLSRIRGFRALWPANGAIRRKSRRYNTVLSDRKLRRSRARGAVRFLTCFREDARAPLSPGHRCGRGAASGFLTSAYRAVPSFSLQAGAKVGKVHRPGSQRRRSLPFSVSKPCRSPRQPVGRRSSQHSLPSEVSRNRHPSPTAENRKKQEKCSIRSRHACKIT